MTTGKTIVLTGWIFAGKVMSLLFNMLSRLVNFFFPKEQASFNFMAAGTICSDFWSPVILLSKNVMLCLKKCRIVKIQINIMSHCVAIITRKAFFGYL